MQFSTYTMHGILVWHINFLSHRTCIATQFPIDPNIAHVVVDVVYSLCQANTKLIQPCRVLIAWNVQKYRAKCRVEFRGGGIVHTS
jgi:hypothetical protein